MNSNLVFSKIEHFLTLKFIRRKSSVSVQNKKWKGVVGLEIHAQINTKSKLFSASASSFGSPVNTNVSFFDAAIPGTLPVLNRKCVELGVITALALSCHISPVSWFDRKHYFYADLPAGYQITQQRKPLARNGALKFPVVKPNFQKNIYYKSSKISQIQLEQDSGKSLHDDTLERSLIDLNRAGVPLMEIVFEPDLCDGEEAASLIKELTLILARINTCTCRMEEGALRVDANVSVHEEGEPLGVRAEVKNIGSIRGVANAVDFEIQRQSEILQSGGRVVNETRSWDAQSGTTVPMRDKEVKQDYRFMPEPNLPPLRLNTSSHFVEGLLHVEPLKSLLPELPEQTRRKLVEEHCLPLGLFVFHLVNEENLLILFNEIMKVKTRNPKTVAKILSIELMTLINKDLTTFIDGRFTASKLGDIADLLDMGSINLNTAKTIMKEIALGDVLEPKEIIQKLGLVQITDLKELTAICKSILDKNPSIVIKYKSGKVKLFSALLGMVAKQTNNRANMKSVSTILKDLLKS